MNINPGKNSITTRRTFTSQTLLTAAAALSATVLLPILAVPLAHAQATSNLPAGLFDGDATDLPHTAISTAIRDYAADPSTPNSNALNTAIASLPPTPLTGTYTVFGAGGTGSGLYLSSDVAGVISLTGSSTLTFSEVAIGLQAVDGSLTVFSAAPGAQYRFTQNTSTSGGAICTQNSDLFLKNAVFTGNTALGRGGAIEIHNDTGASVLDNVVFIDNYTTGVGAAGGAISYQGMTDDNAVLINATFTGNHTDFQGGAIASVNKRLRIINTTFTGNYNDATIGSSAAYGGAVAANALFSKVTFSGNYAVSNNVMAIGGAAFVNDGTSFTDAYFSGNSATVTSNGGMAFGGAIVAIDTGTVTITNSIFSGNSVAATGGGIAHGGAIASLGTVVLDVTANRKSVFDGNTADGAPNSIHLPGELGVSAGLNVTTAPGAVLYMFDPMSAGAGPAPHTITKSDTGTWKLSGTNELPNTNVTVNADGGTLHLYGANEGEAGFAIANFIRADNGTYSSYVFPGKAVGEIPAGRLHLGTGSFVASSGVRVVLGGTGTAITTTGAGGVTFSAGSTVVFKVLSETDHGVIHTDNLVVGNTAKLILDLDPVFAGTVAASLSGIGTIIPGLFVKADGTPLSAQGDFANFVISDSKGRFVWGLSEFGGVQVLGVTAAPAPTPEPSTYALCGGLVVLGFALWRRRGRKLKMKNEK